jgi:UDP-glucose 4-epimerase
MAHYLVTGGAGFIGSHLAEILLARQHRVTVLDDLSTGRLENVATIAGTPGFECVVGSDADAPLVSELVRRCDGIFHLAARLGVEAIVADPIRCLDANTRGTEVVCRAAMQHRRPLLFASSSEVYGSSSQPPFREDAPVVLGSTSASRWSYACAKALGEFRVIAAAQQTDLPVVVARIFNTTGPRQSEAHGMVLPRFVKQAIAGEPLLVHGDGTQTRCFSYVTDTATTLADLIGCANAHGRVFNVGGDEETTILDLAQLVIARANSRSPIHFLRNTRIADVPRRVPNLAKIRSLLGAMTMVGLDEIVTRTIAFALANATPLPVTRAGALL